MNLQWVKSARGEVLRDMDLPENAYERRDNAERPRGVARGGAHIACTLPQWTPGARRYVEDVKSDHYGQPIVDNDRDKRNIEAATHGQFKYDRTQERARARLQQSRRRSGTG